MKLVIVETPSQAKTLTDVLGEGWRVEPCYGLVCDLPTDQLGVDVENDFRPTFTIVPGKSNLVRRLMKAIRESEAVYAATAPNREGEALAWHLLARSPDTKDKSIYRVLLHALTPDAIRAAFAAPLPLDMQCIESDMTERIVDRLVGWSVNTAARKTLGFKTALSYDGMVALRRLVERDHEIAAFTLERRWQAAVEFQFEGVTFTAQVLNAKGAPLALKSKEQSDQLETLLKTGQFWVDKTGQALKSQPVPAALTLFTLVETAHRELRLSPERVLALLHTLYEAGWITFPGSKSHHSLSEATQTFIRREFGTEYLVPDALVTAELAPADVNREPEDLPGDGVALYALIWRSFIAAHMPPAQERIMAARLLVGASKEKPYPLELRATAKLLYFDGWYRVVPTTAQDEVLPFLPEGTTLQPVTITVETVTHESPAHFTEGTLASVLATIGMSAPSVARTVDHLQAAGYVTAEEDRLTLSESGRVMADYLAASFADLTSSHYAAELVADIDRIAAGEQERLEVLHRFWARFGSALRPPPAPRTIEGRSTEHKPIVLRPAEEV
ncbi:MAG: DNA topoisomerase [Phototrophicaceae bacterium]